jgi:hypothetical protein
LITLTFRPVRSESAVLVRGAYFRICADATLRGPDNAVTASYADGYWRLGQRQHWAFESGGPISLRVTSAGGRRECMGPFDFVKAAEGAVFTHHTCLGFHASGGEFRYPADLWREIAFLTGA